VDGVAAVEDTKVGLTMNTSTQERRRRVKMSRPARIRPSDPTDGHFEEVRSTLSASPNGLYFTTWRDTYYKGMRVFVTYPYSAAGHKNCPEFLGEVVCIDALTGLRRGVGVRFLTPISEAS